LKLAILYISTDYINRRGKGKQEHPLTAIMTQSSSNGSITSQVEELRELIATKITALETKTKRKLDVYLTLIGEVMENLGSELMMLDEEPANGSEEENEIVFTITPATSSTVDDPTTTNGAENEISGTITAGTTSAENAGKCLPHYPGHKTEQSSC
jgi:hypothetical protein